jgi:hypothetical protein
MVGGMANMIKSKPVCLLIISRRHLGCSESNNEGNLDTFEKSDINYHMLLRVYLGG